MTDQLWTDGMSLRQMGHISGDITAVTAVRHLPDSHVFIPQYVSTAHAPRFSNLDRLQPNFLKIVQKKTNLFESEF